MPAKDRFGSAASAMIMSRFSSILFYMKSTDGKTKSVPKNTDDCQHGRTTLVLISTQVSSTSQTHQLYTTEYRKNLLASDENAMVPLLDSSIASTHSQQGSTHVYSHNFDSPSVFGHRPTLRPPNHIRMMVFLRFY